MYLTVLDLNNALHIFHFSYRFISFLFLHNHIKKKKKLLRNIIKVAN
jgi:hypothetical protein